MQKLLHENIVNSLRELRSPEGEIWGVILVHGFSKCYGVHVHGYGRDKVRIGVK